MMKLSLWNSSPNLEFGAFCWSCMAASICENCWQWELNHTISDRIYPALVWLFRRSENTGDAFRGKVFIQGLNQTYPKEQEVQ
jgi:hypothetical protein